MSGANGMGYGYNPYIAARGFNRYPAKRDDSKMLGVGFYKMLANTKNLHRNNWLARAIEGAHVSYMSCPMPIGGDDLATGIYLDWWNHAGVTGCGLDDIYTQWISQQTQNGDVLIVFASNPNAKTLVKSRLQVVDSSRVRTPDDLIDKASTRGNMVIHGVEIDAYGAEVGYWVCKTKDGDYQLGSSENFTFFYRADPQTGRPVARLLRRPDSLSPSSTRGLPSISSIVPEIEDLGDLTAAAIQGAYTKAMLSVILTSPNPTQLQSSLSVEVDTNGKPVDSPSGYIGGLESGSVITAPPGTLVNTVNSSGNIDLVSLITEELRHVSGAVQIPLEILMSNFANINFSSSKNSFDKFLRVLQRWTDSNVIFLTEIFAWVVIEGLLAKGQIPSDQQLKIHWSPISLPSANPQQEAMSQQILLQNGLETRSGLLAKKGISYKDHLVTLKTERELEIQILGAALDDQLPNGDKIAPPDANNPEDLPPIKPAQGK